MVVLAAVLQVKLELWAMLLISASELILLPMAQLANSYCFAVERGLPSALSVNLVPGGRLLATFVLYVVGVTGTPFFAAAAHFSGSIAGLISAVYLIKVIDGWPAWKDRLATSAATKEGTSYALGAMSNNSYLEIDKILILQLLGAAVLGPYTVAFRVVSMIALPVSAIVAVVLPRMFSTYGTEAFWKTLKIVTCVALGFSVLAGLMLALVSNWVPLLFGKDYTEVAHYVVLFAAWPALYAFHQCTAAGLTASNHQGTRLAIEGLALTGVFMANFAFLRSFGPAIAIQALLAAEIFVGVVSCIILGKAHARIRTPR